MGKAQYYENTVQWDACQEQSQQCSGICLSLEDKSVFAAEDRANEVTQIFWRTLEDTEWIGDIGHYTISVQCIRSFFGPPASE